MQSGILGPDGRPVSVDRIRMEKQSRFNPIANWTPDVLVRQLVAYSRGEIAALAYVMEWLERHDEVIQTVAPKAKAAVSRYGYDIVFKDEIRPEQKGLAEEQQGRVQEFYQSIQVGDAVDLEEAGGTRLLFQQVMDAYGKGYAAHHIIWQPGPSLTAELSKVPTWFFETKTGRMRFLPSTWAFDGTDLEYLGGRNAWMISRGRGVMLAGVIARMFKQLPLQDWLTYCDRHGMPAFLGKTKAKKGSGEWNDMATAVGSIGSEFGAVVNVDDVIDVLDLKGSGELPYEKLVDRMDRAQVMLWRGGDLSTISRSDGTGSNPQQEESDELDADNAAWVSETLNRNLTDRVVRYYHGNAPVLVKLQLRTKTRDNITQDLNVAKTFKDSGERVSASWAANKFGVVLAEAEERAWGEPEKPQPAPTPINSKTGAESDLADDLQDLRELLSGVLKPLGEAMWNAYQKGDYPATQGALKKILKDLPDHLGDTAELAEEIGIRLAEALTAEDDAPITPANTGNSAGAIKGWATRRANGWQAKPKEATSSLRDLVDDALDNARDPSDLISFYGDVTPEEAHLLGLEPGYRRGLSRHAIRHMMKSHGDPKTEDARGQIAITRDDIKRIPVTLNKEGRGDTTS